jgi:hypothetical protein
MHHDDIGVVHDVPGIRWVPDRRIMLHIYAGQAALLFAEYLILIGGPILIGLKKDTIERKVPHFFSGHGDDIAAEGKGAAQSIIAFLFSGRDGNIDSVITL